MSELTFIGELMNNSYGRTRRAWRGRDLAGYQALATLQAALGANYLTLNLDGTQTLDVRQEEMLEFLPIIIPAIQAATPTPIAFDSPSLCYHQVALKNYDRARSGQPILNSLSASRQNLTEMIELVAEFDTKVIIMASEHLSDNSATQCLDPKDCHRAARYFVERVMQEASRVPDDIIIDIGLAPVGADTYGLVNIGLDAMRLIRQDPDLAGVHMSVGLSNFAWGTPKHVQHLLECAYLTLATEAGLDWALAHPERRPAPLPVEHAMVRGLRHALEQGRRVDGDDQEDAGFRQASAILELFKYED